MKRKFFSALITAGMILSLASCGRSVDSSEAAAVKQTCIDYTDAFYKSDGETLKKVLHPQFMKMNTEGNVFDIINIKDFIELACRFPRPRPEIKVYNIDVFKGIAAAIIESTSVEYVNLVKTEGKWQIVSILWEVNLIK